MNDIKHRLSTKPPGHGTPHSLMRIDRILLRNLHRLAPSSTRRRIRQQLRMTALLQANEPKHRLLNTPAHGQQPMILQQRSFATPERGSNLLAFFLGEDHAAEAGVERVVVVERARILRDSIEFAAQCAEGAAVDGVRVRGADYIRPGFVDRVVDHVGGGVEEADFAAIDDFALVVDEDEV